MAYIQYECNLHMHSRSSVLCPVCVNEESVCYTVISRSSSGSQKE